MFDPEEQYKLFTERIEKLRQDIERDHRRSLVLSLIAIGVMIGVGIALAIR